jgi:hypothetical protein
VSKLRYQSRIMKKMLLCFSLCITGYLLNAQATDSIKRKQAPSSPLFPKNAIIKSSRIVRSETVKDKVTKGIDSILSALSGMPNNPSTWTLAKSRITDFLLLKYRDGKLVGSKDSEAFYVKVDASTMTQADINSGKLVAEVGFAVVKPAEFEMLRFVKQL